MTAGDGVTGLFWVYSCSVGSAIYESGNTETSQGEIRSDYTDMSPVCSHNILFTRPTHREQQSCARTKPY